MTTRVVSFKTSVAYPFLEARDLKQTAQAFFIRAFGPVSEYFFCGCRGGGDEENERADSACHHRAEVLLDREGKAIKITFPLEQDSKCSGHANCPGQSLTPLPVRIKIRNAKDARPS